LLVRLRRQLGINHRRTAYHHPESSSFIERFHRSLKEEEVWTSEYRSLAEARENIGRYPEEYNHDRLHRGVENRIPLEAYLALKVSRKQARWRFPVPSRRPVFKCRKSRAKRKVSKVQKQIQGIVTMTSLE
jgi:integrase-like protein